VTAAPPPAESTRGLESTFGRGAVQFRRRLAIAGAVVVVALVALGSVLAWRQYDDGKQDALGEIHARVKLAAIVFDVYFSGQVNALTAIAKAPAVQDRDTDAIAAYLHRVQPTNGEGQPFNAGIGWIDRDGNYRASNTTPTGPGVDVSDRDYFKQVMATGAPYISNGLTTRLGKQQVVVVAVPTRDAGGKLTGLLAGASVITPATGQNPQAAALGFENLVLLDSTGKQLTLPSFARAKNMALVEEIRSGEGVKAGVTGLDGGKDRVVGYANAASPRWTVAIDRPASTVFASARRALTLELFSIAIAAIVVLSLLAWAIVRSRREVETDREQVRRWDELSQSLGEASVPADVTGALVSSLATAFPHACLIVAFEAEDQPGLVISAVRPGEDGPSLRRENPIALDLARLAYDRGGIVAARDLAAVRELAPRMEDQLADEVGSLYALPLLTRTGRAAGSVTLLLPEEEPLSRTEEALVAAQAEHAGLALTRARRYAQEHDVAIALQRSLLPETLPKIEGIDLAGRYSAGGVGLEVGGDWYDALRRPDGIVHLTVGDVAGRGIGAAVLMGQLRHAYRALAFEHTSPAEIARRMLRHVPDAGMATAVFLTFDPFTGELAYTSAGHPPTLLHDAETGEVTLLDQAASPPLGWAQGKAIGEERLQLTSQSTLLAYTDGLVERRGASIDDGIELLGRLLAEHAERPAASACDAILNSVLSASPADDDMALLLIKATEVPATMAIEVPSEPAVMRSVRLRVGTWLERRGVGEDQRADTVLAITEACNNAIEHGYRGQGGTIRLSLEHRGNTLAISVEDEGRWREPRPDPTRGRGLVIMKSTMHRADITPGKAGTRVDLELKLPGGRVAPLGVRGS
jgi:serine phosphatase RsbU (regulator of sigma subunit)/anti-sigma regulatory factor (Ser/Thr protein kinase)